MTRRPHIALLPDGRRLHLQDGPIDLVIEAFGPAEAVRAAQAAAARRFDGLLDELCAELPLLRAPARPEGTVLTGPVALRMHEAVAPHAALPFSRVREKVPEGRMRARPAEPGRGGGASPRGVPTPSGRRPSSGAARHLLPRAGEGDAAAVAAHAVASLSAAVEAPAAIPPFGVIPGLVPGTHSSPGSQASPLPDRRMGSRHKAGNDFGDGGAFGEGHDFGDGADVGVGGEGPAPGPFITPMAAVAGAVADEILAAMLAGTAGRLTRAYVNNGGDIALFLAPGERFRIGLVDRPDRPSLDASALFARTEIAACDGIGGIATSGWRGRSFSLGIADAVTVLAKTAAEADAAATIIANAVDLPGHRAIVRVPARELQPDSDLGDRRVTRGVGALSDDEIDAALAAGVVVAEGLVRRGLIAGAALHLAGATRVVGIRLVALAGSTGIASLGVAAISSI